MPTKDEHELLQQCQTLRDRAAELSTDPERDDLSKGDFHQALRHLEIACHHLERHEEQRGPAISRSLTGIVSRLMASVGPTKSESSSSQGDDSGSRKRSVPLTGSSENVPLPDLISFLQTRRKSGVLKVVGDEEIFTIEIEQGELVHASSDSSPRKCRLGEVLVRQGFIGEDRLNDFLNEYANRQGKLGEALWREELVTQESLRTALELQVQQLFHRLFETSDAYFYFIEGDSEDGDLSIRMNVTKLLMESARVHDEVQGLRRAMQSDGECSEAEPAGHHDDS